MARERAGGPWRTKEEGSLLLGSVLWATDRLSLLFRAFGVDYPVFRELLRVRVLIGLRPASPSSSAWALAGTVLSVLMLWLLGLFTGLVALLAEDPRVWVVVSQSVLFGLLVFVLFLQFAGILVDPADIGVVAPHPVEDRTVFAARLAEAFAYLLIFVASFTAGNVMLAVFRKPPLAVLLVYPVLSLLCALTALGAVALLFALCLRIVGPSRFQRVTLWVQILGGLVLFGGLQLSRAVPDERWAALAEDLEPLRRLWPPFQYAELFDLASGKRGPDLAAALLALLMPAAGLALTLWLASRYFVAGLQGTLGAPGRGPTRWGGGLVSRLGRWLARGREERAGFDFALDLSRREPHYLRGVLPQLAMFQFMALGMGLGMRGDIPLFLPMSAGFLFMALPNILMLSQSTPTPEARWAFVSAPVEREEALLRGGLKALLVQWIGLPGLLLFCVQLLVAGPSALPRIVLALELAFVMALFFARLFELGVPFTRPIRVGEAGATNLALVFGMTLGLLVLWGIHALLALHPLALAAGIVATAFVLRTLWRRIGSVNVPADRKLRPDRGKLYL